jgi:hypothetical protein
MIRGEEIMRAMKAARNRLIFLLKSIAALHFR